MQRLILSSSKNFIAQRFCNVSVPRNFATAVSTTTTTAPTPTVFDKIVSLNFIDPSGARRQVPAYIGKTIYETCEMNDIDLGPCSVGGSVEEVRSETWTEPLYGEGPTTGYDHILLVGNGVKTAKPKTWVEDKMLSQYWDEDEIFPESRLASQVIVTKEMDGMTVYVPDRIVDDIP